MTKEKNEYLIELKNIHKGLYDTNGITINKNIIVLNNVNFNVKSGEVHVLLGENGAGKSTLMKILSGAILADSGTIFIEGNEGHIQNPYIAHMLGVSIVTQEFSLSPNRSVAQNVFLGREPRKRFLNLVDIEELREKATKILAILKVELDVNKSVKDLTTAQQQLVEIAKALSLNPRVLILDEPTSSLADDQIIQLFKVIRALKEQGVGIIYISHRLKEVLEIGDRVTVLRDGHTVETKNVKEVNLDEIIQMMIGRKISNMFQRISKGIGDVALEVKSLSKGNGFKDINLSVRTGEIVGLAGIIGAGRTELARAIFGIDKFDSGEVIIFGDVIKIGSPIKLINKHLGFLPEDRKKQGIIPLMSVSENMNLVSMSYIDKRFWVNRKKVLKNFSEYVKDFDMAVSSSDQESRYLSGGNQQKLVLAKWLCAKSKIFIFDEPTRGIDVGAKANIYTLINNMAKQGAAILIISSDLPEIIGLSDRIYVMHKGQIVVELEGQKSTEEEVLNFAVGGYRSRKIDVRT